MSDFQRHDRLVTTAGGLARLQVSRRGPVTVLGIAGELDISNIGEVRGVVADLSNHELGLVLDFTELEYLDSTGISLLYEMARRLRQRDQELVVVCPVQAPPRRAIEITGLGAQTRVFEELEPAMSALGGD